MNIIEDLAFQVNGTKQARDKTKDGAGDGFQAGAMPFGIS
jgi:hypothetical protein